MASLQEQLLKAGLADKKQAKQARQDKHKKIKQQQKHKQVSVDENKAAVELARQEKLAKDQSLNLERKQEAEKKAITAQVKQLIELNRQPKNNGEVPCNFEFEGKVKRIFVSDKTHKHVTQGRLAIVLLGNDFELVPMPVADKIAERAPESVVYRADKLTIDNAKDDLNSEEDDWYADYEIPDDLVW